ncbi:unnamed protein product [Lactuca saligna]|uniref:Uncharacterized protein n=1 Tax=Lactuca saligna TaxID=75948 RepID=A0AA35Z4V6_LACSI|nr:unnamed protein product [Lactuca saligna]
MIHLASPLVTSPPATSGLPHYKSTNDKLILITEWFHSQLGVRLLHRTDDYECDSSTTPVIASRLTSLTATLIGLSIQLDFSFQLEIDFVPSPALHLFTKISLHLSTKIFTISSRVLQCLIFLIMDEELIIIEICELLALGEQIGNAGSGLSEDFISGGLLFNMMIRVAAENQQACGNKSLYNDRVESFATAAGEGQDRGLKRCSSSSDGGKKKGKKGRQIDPALLGFKVRTADKTRSLNENFGGWKLKDVAVDAHIRSYCWSGDLIRSSFSSVDAHRDCDLTK